jgi:outer membrane receptor protein involved in Fe transport
MRLLRSCAVFAMAMAGPLTAQVPDTLQRDTTAVQLDPIEVVGTIRPAAGPTIGSGIPARVTNLSPAEVDAYEPRVLSDVAQRLASFSTYDDLGSPYKLNISTRGFYASPVVGLPQGVAVFLDGVRMNEPEASQVNFDLLPMDHIQRIEVLSGNGSLLGRNALGGAINLVTAHGRGPTRATFEASGGSFGSFRGEGNVSGLTRGGIDWYVGGGYNREDGWRQVTGGEQYHGFFNLGKLSESAGIRFQGFYSNSRVETAGSLPETVFLVAPDSNLSANDYEDLWQFQGALQGYKRLGQGQASATLYYRRHRAERFNANQPADPDVFGISYNSSFGYTADYRWARLLSDNVALAVRGGVDGSITRVSIDIFNDSTKFGGGVPLRTQARSPLWDIAPFLAADLTTGPLTVSAGARFDYVRIPFENQLDPSQDTVGVYDQLNPRVGATVEVAPGAAVFASWARSFRAPAVIENACADPESPCPLPFALGDDPPLEPVTASTFEAGVRYIREGLALSASGYYSDVKNDIFLTPFGEEEPEGGTIDGYFVNLDKTRRSGFELEGSYQFPGGHLVYANYAFTRATFQTPADIFSIRSVEDEPVPDDPDEEPVINPFPTENDVEPGNRFPLVPDHQVKAGARVKVGRYLTVGADARYIGKQWLRGDEANVTDQLDDYIVTDARVGVEFGRWEVTGMVTNLFQNRYAVFGGYNINQGNPDGATVERFLSPGHERMFRLVVRTRLGGGSGPDNIDLDD